MHDEKPRLKRRRLLRLGLMGLAALPAARLLAPVEARAADMPKLSLDNSQAKALSYHHDATRVDNAARQEDQICRNCQLYSGDPEAQWGQCGIFAGKVVNADGWCLSYAANP